MTLNAIPLRARGQAAAAIVSSEAFKVDRVNRASGDASRFTQREAAYRRAPESTATRLYLETMEEILPGREKFIVDRSSGGRRTLFAVEDGVLLAPSGAPMAQPPQPFPAEPEE